MTKNMGDGGPWAEPSSAPGWSPKDRQVRRRIVVCRMPSSRYEGALDELSSLLRVDSHKHRAAKAAGTPPSGHDEVQGRTDRSCGTVRGGRLIRELSSSLQLSHQRLSRLQVLQFSRTKTPTLPLSKRINPPSCIDMKCLAYGMPGREKKDRWRR